MSETKPIEIVARSVERAVNSANGQNAVRVRFAHTTPDGFVNEWAIWIQNEDSFARAEELARAELHRLSTLIANQPVPAEGAPEVDAEAKPDGERLKMRRRPQPDGPKTWMGR